MSCPKSALGGVAEIKTQQTSNFSNTKNSRIHAPYFHRAAVCCALLCSRVGESTQDALRKLEFRSFFFGYFALTRSSARSGIELRSLV
jgi:hypothetical protein